MEDSLVVEEDMLVKFSLVPFASCLLHLQLLLQGSFHQEEVKQPHSRDTQRPNIMNHLGSPEAPYHLPLATLLRDEHKYSNIRIFWCLNKYLYSFS